MKEKIRVNQFAALLFVLLINSLAVILIVKSDFGVSTLSSVPHVLSQCFPIVSYGTWNIIFQLALMLILVVLTKKQIREVVFSLLLTLAFGYFLDLWLFLMKDFPTFLVMRFVYYVVGVFILSLGATMFLFCDLPILPLDSFVRSIAIYYDLDYVKTKVGSDILFVIMSLSLSLLFLGYIYGVGLGTVISAIVIGPIIGFFKKLLDRHFTFYKPKSRYDNRRESIES